MPKLQRLVYYSRKASPSSASEFGAEISQILEASRRNNANADLTGALMFNHGCFAQVLEGPRCAVEQTFERIQRDPRHAAVVVLDYAPAEARAFPDWSMAFVSTNAPAHRAFDIIGQDATFDAAHVSGDGILQSLQELVRDEGAAAA